MVTRQKYLVVCKKTKMVKAVVSEDKIRLVQNHIGDDNEIVPANPGIEPYRRLYKIFNICVLPNPFGPVIIRTFSPSGYFTS